MAEVAFDLNKLAALLKNDRRYAYQVRVLEEFASACSILTDLKVAMESMLTLSLIQSEDTPRKLYGQALMMHAVITYCRALVSRTDNRRTINVVGKAFTKTQQAKHAALADLRSTALAHYNKPLGPYAAEWIDDRSVVICRDGKFDPPKDVFSRHNYKKGVAEDLVELLDVAILYVGNERARRSIEVTKVLDNARSDEFFQKKLDEAGFDPVEYFLNKDAARSFWDQESFQEETHIVAQ